MNNKKNQENGFFYKTTTIQWILRIFYSLCVLLILVDFIVHRHVMTNLEKIPAFYAWYGFVSCVGLVFVASGIRKWLMRDDDYYHRRQTKYNKNIRG